MMKHSARTILSRSFVRLNGKVKSKLTIPTDAAKDDVIALAKADEAIVKATECKNIVKEIYVPNKLVNLVVK